MLITWQTIISINPKIAIIRHPAHNKLPASDISFIQQQTADSPLIFYGNDSSIISQAIGDSPELTALEKQPDDLTAMEKITKLKQQLMKLIS
jgi:hypothetical protein